MIILPWYQQVIYMYLDQSKLSTENMLEFRAEKPVVTAVKKAMNSASSEVGSISAALSCLVYPPREETAERVSSKACLWRKFII